MNDFPTIVTLGHPTLHSVAQPVTNIKDEAVEDAIKSLLAAMLAADGVGIAAPQLGLPWRIIIVASRPNPRYPFAPTMEPLVAIDPYLASHGEEREKGWEGCLSVPGLRGMVPRYREVTIAYSDRDGIRHERTFDGFVARIFQHELDHLDGKVFLDRLDSDRDLYSEQDYQRLIHETTDSDRHRSGRNGH